MINSNIITDDLKNLNKDWTAPNGVVVPAKYKPTDTEEFMNPVMTEYFRRKLIIMRDEFLHDLQSAMKVVVDNTSESITAVGDDVDSANDETLRQIQLSTTENYRNDIEKINLALKRIDSGDFGYCVITGDPIAVKRLDARPLSSKTLEAQEAFEDEQYMFAEN